jgi:hypothetical protein
MTFSEEASRMSNETLPGGRTPDLSTADVMTDIEPEASARGPVKPRQRVAQAILFISIGFLLGAVSVLAYVSFRSSTDSSPSQEIVEPKASASAQSALDHFSFTASSGREDGWTHYESAIEGVALELPSGWGPFPVQEYPPDLILNASDSFPFTGYGAVLYVMRRDIGRTPTDAGRYWGLWRRQIATTPDLVHVTMTTTTVPSGEAYVFRSVYRRDGAEYVEMMYGLVSGTTEYRLIFDVAADRSSQYEGVFDDIVQTLSIS